LAIQEEIMQASLDLSATEARMFRAYWQDGLIDLLAGATLILIGLGWLLGIPLGVLSVTPGVAVVFWPLLRRTITEPRLGRVRFSAKRQFRMHHGAIALLALGVLLGGLVTTRVFLADQTSAFLRWIAPGIPVLIMAVLALSVSGVLRLLRFVGYAATFAIAAVIVAGATLEPGWALFGGGVVVTVMGGVLLVRFLREFPRLSQEMDE
jgi:hypothetical protein